MARNPGRLRRVMRVAWWALPAVLALAGAGYYYFYLAMPVGKGPAGPAVPREPFSEVWTERPVLLLGVGDSVTAGFGVDPSRGLSYFARLADNPPDEFPDMEGICLRRVLPNLQTRNLSVSGSTSDQHLRGQIEPLEVQPAEVFGLVVMTSGGNDLIHNYGRTPPRPNAMFGATLAQAQPWIDDFRLRLNAMVIALRDRFPGGCLIFLANIYDPSDGLGDPESVGMPPWPDLGPILAAYNRIIAECAERHDFVRLVDMHGPFLGHGIHCTQPWTPHYRIEDPHFWYAPVLEDPNERGYDAIRRLFLIEMLAARAEWPGGA